MSNMQPRFEEELLNLLESIHDTFKYDFRSYSRPSLKRRMALALETFKCATIGELEERILKEPELLFELLQFLTINVSEMFRDPEYFRYFREKVVPLLKTFPSLKIWVAGCSTGEEAYSLAIILYEEGLLDRTIIYATDINLKSLHRAEVGIFRMDQLQKLTKNYQLSGGKKSFADYYTAAYDAAVFNKLLKNKIVFMDHCLATDNVFSKVHFISCRNVLIYFEKKLQERVIDLFLESLGRNGFLGLCSQESIEYTKHFKAFHILESTNKFYQKNENETVL